MQVGEGYGFFGYKGSGGDKVGAENAVEEAGVKGRGYKLLAFTDKKVADGSFGEFVAFVEEEDFVEVFLAGEGEVWVVEFSCGGFVAK